MSMYTVTLKITGEIVVRVRADSPDDAKDEVVDLVESSHIPTEFGDSFVHIYPQDIVEASVEKT